MREVKNPHDKFFKRTMNDPEVAKDIVQNYLPHKILKLIDVDSLEPEKDSFVEKELKEYFSDLLYRVNLLDGEAYIYFLFEHKSYPYQKIALQLLKYMREIWNLKLEADNEGKLPIILPIVIYHGRTSWNIDLKLSDLLVDIPEELKAYVPNFKYLLYDFSPYNGEEIKGD